MVSAQNNFLMPWWLILDYFVLNPDILVSHFRKPTATLPGDSTFLIPNCSETPSNPAVAYPREGSEPLSDIPGHVD